ncbi:MAG TPA: sigma-70 family RNA polymerase sigma factor [Anaeromyxobacteraceae bacterium]|nr:sigma-70 family RNA polymerase sigma factor [Anaeromyxobacteraceae bacterium]
MPASDEELLSAARSGDRAALEELLTRHQRSVFRFGMKMCGEEEDAKDVLQETLIAAARSIREFRGASSLSTWLYTIARSFCVKRHRTSKFAPSEVESLDAHAAAARQVPDTRRGPEEAAAGEQLRLALKRAIASLEPAYREVLVLRDVEGLPAAEVGEILGLSVEAVKSRLHRARVSVRQEIAPWLGVPEPAGARPDGSCPDVVDLFSRHLEGEISGEVCASLEKHLEGCAACRARCDSLRASLSLCSRSGEQVPPRVEQAVREALRRFVES